MYFSPAVHAAFVAVGQEPAIHFEDAFCDATPVGGCFVPRGLGSCGPGKRLVFPQFGGEPIRIGAWPHLGGPLAVAGTTRPAEGAWSFEAVFGTVDPFTQRFFPGVVRLGNGIGRDMAEDPAGRLWVELPWSGELVRITAQ